MPQRKRGGAEKHVADRSLPSSCGQIKGKQHGTKNKFLRDAGKQHKCQGQEPKFSKIERLDVIDTKGESNRERCDTVSRHDDQPDANVFRWPGLCGLPKIRAAAS